MAHCPDRRLVPSERAHFWHESVFAGKRVQIEQKEWVQDRDFGPVGTKQYSGFVSMSADAGVKPKRFL